jgi:uroporphyrinogen III methyltransferase / synthase
MTVYLVGAGPGDPGLLTVRGAEILCRADVVVHDRLSEPRLLELAPADAELIDVGKSPGSPVPQDHINGLLIERGRAGLTVVRLKGGDPFVFGRGGEEALALNRAGVDFEVVPGITSAVAVPAYAGVPVTHRGRSTSFTVVTGHSRFAVDEDTNWNALAAAGGTIVILMGVAHRAEIAKRLIEGGLPPDTAVVAVTWGTRPQQRTVRTVLGELGNADLEPPATIVVGAVAGLDLGWFERRPLFGRRVIVTRAREQASDLSSLLRGLGADAIEVPAIQLGDPSDGGTALRRAAERLRQGQYQWVVFTSARAVERFVPLLRDARSFGSTLIAAIGPGTADELARHHLVADLVPGEYIAEDLVEAMPSGPGTVLVPRAAVARDVLPEGLRSKGWTVEVVEAYRTQAVPLSTDRRQALVGADAITFTSSSTVTNFLAVAGLEAIPPLVACIGPVTASAATAAGLSVDVVATEHTVRGLVDALVTALAAKPAALG